MPRFQPLPPEERGEEAQSPNQEADERRSDRVLPQLGAELEEPLAGASRPARDARCKKNLRSDNIVCPLSLHQDEKALF